MRVSCCHSLSVNGPLLTMFAASVQRTAFPPRHPGAAGKGQVEARLRKKGPAAQRHDQCGRRWLDPSCSGISPSLIAWPFPDQEEGVGVRRAVAGLTFRFRQA
jgi:hypothetical protein